MKRVLVTGCRRWNCHALARSVIARLKDRHGDVTIVHGAASGVDSAFASAAIVLGCSVESFPADWDNHGKAAGPIRNRKMVATKPDICLAVHRDLRGSKGTKNCVLRAIAAGIPTWLIDSDSVEMKQVFPVDLA